MKKLTAYCVSKRKKVTIKKVKQVWKSKSSRGHYLYLLEGEAPGCDTSVWRAVGKDDAEKIAKEIGKAIKTRVSSGKKKAKRVKRAKSKTKRTVKRKVKRAKSKTKRKVKKAKAKTKSKSRRRR